MPDPTGTRSLNILGGRVDSLSMEDIYHQVNLTIKQEHFSQIVTVNSLMLLESYRDSELQTIFNRASLVVPDSIGVMLVSALKGFQLPQRIPGIDLMMNLCQKAEQMKWSVYLVGSKPGVAEATAKKTLPEFSRFDCLRDCPWILQ